MRYYKQPMAMTALVASLFGLLLTGCASVPTKEPLTLPTRLFQCLQEPTPPNLNDGTQDSQVALFIKDLAYAGRDCRDQLAEIGETLDLQPDIEIADIVTTETKKRSKVLGIF